MKTPREILERLFDDAFNIEQALKELKTYFASRDEVGITMCPKCFCMTKNICGKCGKVKEV